MKTSKKQEGSGCSVCGWDAGEVHDPLPHYLKDLHDGNACPVDPAIRIIKVYLKGLADLSAICADPLTLSRKKLERIDVRLMQLEREAREAVKGKKT